jgi:succinoglycan biosynthesis protein ExoL
LYKNGIIKKALFILPVATQPRFSKRIKWYLDNGYIVTVASFERDYLSQNELPVGIEYYCLGKIQNNNYIKRIPKIINSLMILFPLAKKHDLILIFSADVLVFLSHLLQAKRIYYEIGDIREIKQYLVRNIFNTIYGNALKRCDSIFVTSNGFKEYIKNKYFIEDDRIKVIENKLDKNIFKESSILSFRHLKSSYFTVGIVGLFRYNNIIHFLEAYKKIRGLFKIALYGDGPLLKIISQYIDNENINYFGSFKYPDDLNDIYNRIDISFTMYDAEDLNVRLALPNKLYESMHFKKPIIVSHGTFLEEKVLTLNIGFSWDQNNMEGLIKYLNSAKFIEDYNVLDGNFNKIQREEYLA